MSTHTTTYQRCNGCGKSTLDDGIEIAQSLPRNRVFSQDGTIDVCQTCADAGKYPCPHCKGVHDDDNACAAVRHLMDEANAICREETP